MSTRRTGLIMIVMAWIVGLGLIALVFSRTIDDRQNPNANPASEFTADSVDVTLRANRQGHFVAGGRLNGVDAVFLLDTGATDVVVSETLAARAGLARGRAQRANTAAGAITVYDTVIDRVQLGGIILQGVQASINPHMQGDDVLLGMSFLGRLEMTQRNGVLQLKSRRPN